MEEWRYEGDLKLNLVATQLGTSGQSRDLVEGTRELLGGFNQCRAFQRPQTRLAPKARCFLD
jgi:hypothetical protein